MERLIKAWRNSLRAFGRLLQHEKAFQQELFLLAVSLPLSILVAKSASGRLLLIGSVVFLLIVEVLNTGIEAACDAVSREFNIDIQLAKDCGSLAVLMSIVLVGGAWVFGVVRLLQGAPI